MFASSSCLVTFALPLRPVLQGQLLSVDRAELSRIFCETVLCTFGLCRQWCRGAVSLCCSTGRSSRLFSPVSRRSYREFSQDLHRARGGHFTGRSSRVFAPALSFDVYLLCHDLLGALSSTCYVTVFSFWGSLFGMPQRMQALSAQDCACVSRGLQSIAVGARLGAL